MQEFTFVLALGFLPVIVEFFVVFFICRSVGTWVSLRSDNKLVVAVLASSLFLVLFALSSKIFTLGVNLMFRGEALELFSLVIALTGIGTLIFLLGWVLRIIGVFFIVRNMYAAPTPAVPPSAAFSSAVRYATIILVLGALALLYTPARGLVAALPQLRHPGELFRGLIQLQQDSKRQQEEERRRDAERDQQLTEVQAMIERYKTIAGVYPGSYERLQYSQGWSNLLPPLTYVRVDTDDYQLCGTYSSGKQKCVSPQVVVPVEGTPLTASPVSTATVDDEPVVYTSTRPVVTGTATEVSNVCVWIRLPGAPRPQAVQGPESIPDLLWGGCSPDEVVFSGGHWSAKTNLPVQKLTSRRGDYTVLVTDKSTKEVLTAKAIIVRPQ